MKITTKPTIKSITGPKAPKEKAIVASIRPNSLLRKAIDSYAETLDTIKELGEEAEYQRAIIAQFVKDRAIDMLANDSLPSNVIYETDQRAVQCIVKDQFKKPKKGDIADLKTILGSGGIKNDKIYSFAPKMIKKYKSKIVAALQTLDIPEEDLKALLVETDSFDYGFDLSGIKKQSTKAGVSIRSIFECVSPTIEVKVIE